MSAINLKKVLAAAAVSGALGFTAVGLGAGVANADDDWGPWVPWHPGEIIDNWVPWHPGEFIPNWSPWHGDWEDSEGD